MKAALLALLIREFRLANRIGGGAAMGVVFFLILVTIVPFSIGPDLNLLSRIGPAILWIAALLATLLGLDRLFQSDQEDGSLDALRMGEAPLELVVATKCIAHWAATPLPLAPAAPLLGPMLATDPPAPVRVHPSPSAGPPPPTLSAPTGSAARPHTARARTCLRHGHAMPLMTGCP